MERYYRNAVRKIHRDSSAVARQLARDIAFMDTFDFSLPLQEREEYVVVGARVTRNIYNMCGIENGL